MAKVQDYQSGENARVDLLNRYETAAVLDFMLRHMESEARGKLMRAFPEIYNRLYQAEIMRATELEQS